MKILFWLKNNYFISIIIIFSTAFRLYQADFQSLWLDEILTMNNANPKLTFRQFYDGIMFWEFIPHLYFYLLKIVFQVFGYTTLVARTFSALIGVAGVYAMYLLARALFDKKSGLIAASLLCVNSFHIMYSQEIRPYGLLLLFTVLSFYRLVLFIKKNSVQNALIYGLFTGLIVNCHFFGFITIFAQCLILLFFLITNPSNQRKKFFINAIIFFFTTILVFLPAFEPFVRASNINSFWLTTPGPSAITDLLKDLLGNSELTLFIIHFAVLFYLFNLFTCKLNNFSAETIFSNKITFSAIIVFCWLFISLILPLVRSHISVPMILSRYFINIIPALLLIVTASFNLIENKIAKTITISCFVMFSVIDLVVIKKYYVTPVKTQFRELTDAIKKKTYKKTAFVSFWTWLFPYYLENNENLILNSSSQSFEDYIAKLKSNAVDKQSFWYADANSRPYNLKSEDEEFLNTHFILQEKLEYIDSWARYYKLKNEPKEEVTKAAEKTLSLASFAPNKLDNGKLYLFENAALSATISSLKKGKYQLVINALSIPDKPINSKNAHFIIKKNNTEIANYFLSEKSALQKKTIPFEHNNDNEIKFEIIYDNDIFEDGKDRNALINSVSLEKL